MKIIFILAKLILSALLLAFFATRFDLSSLVEVLGSTLGVKALLTGIMIVLLQSIFGSLRLIFILKIWGDALTLFHSFRIWFIGCFFSQAMISFVGGDAMRIWSLVRLQVPIRTASNAVLLDRVIGFIALIAVFLISLPFLFKIIQVPLMLYNVVALAFIGAGAIVFYILLGFVPLKFIQPKSRYLNFLLELMTNSRFFLRSPKNSTLSFLLSLLLHVLNGCALFAIFHCYQVDISLFWCLVISIPVMLIALLPISFAGWGVRESAMIAGFELLNIDPEKTLAVSVTFGLAMLLGSLPGLACFLFERKRKTTVTEAKLSQNISEVE